MKLLQVIYIMISNNNKLFLEDLSKIEIFIRVFDLILFIYLCDIKKIIFKKNHATKIKNIPYYYFLSAIEHQVKIS